MEKRRKLYSYLKEIGISPSMETFPERKRLQKIVYLFQIFGLDLSFRYKWYLHGPYSSALTNILFNNDGRRDFFKLTIEEAAIINDLKKYLGNDVNSSDILELIVSLHYLRQLGINVKASKKQVIDALKEKKPFYSEIQINNYWNKLDLLERY